MPDATAPDDPDDDAREPTRFAGLRGELRLLGAGLAFGLVLLPPLVYVAGAATLGPYEGGIAAFLGKLYGDAVHGVPAALALLLGPYALFMVLRLLSRPARRRAPTA